MTDLARMLEEFEDSDLLEAQSAIIKEQKKD